MVESVKYIYRDGHRNQLYLKSRDSNLIAKLTNGREFNNCTVSLKLGAITLLQHTKKV